MVRPDFESRFNDLLTDIEDLANLEQLEKSLKTLEARSLPEQRMCAHLEAKWLMNRDRRPEARARIDSALRDFGPHVGLLADACVCHYLEGEHLEWRHLLKRLESEFRANAPKLKPLSRFKTALLLGKFFEEEGGVASALRLYRETQDGLDPVAAPESYFLLLSQRVRLNAQFDLREDASELYQQLCDVEKRDPRLYARTEVQHALTLAEAVWFGNHSALERASTLSAVGLPEWDKRLLYFDLFEEFLSRGLEVELLRSWVRDIDMTQLDLFEELILKLAESDFSTESIRTALRRIDALSSASVLRILNLCIRSGRNRELGAELARRLDVHLRALDPASRKMWLRRFEHRAPSLAPSADVARITVHFDSSTREIRSGDRSRRLRSQADLLQGILSLGSGAALDRVAETLGPAGAGWYDRTRMSLQRLNEAVFELTGERKAFYISQGAIHQSAGIEFQWS